MMWCWELRIRRLGRDSFSLGRNTARKVIWPVPDTGMLMFLDLSWREGMVREVPVYLEVVYG